MYNNSNELYHHGVMGMHWGIRRYQPYRKGDKVKGGKEIGKATKVEQRPIGERIKKAIASVNKIKKEIHKGNEEKAEYKFKMAQLKAAKKEVKKAQRREKEERIRERIREHREEQRMERQEAEERRERNWQRARDIANDAATIGTMLYGAYQLKKSMQGERGVGSPSGGSSPSITTSSSSSGTRGRLTSYNPNSHGSSSGTSGSTLPTITTSGSGSRSGASRPRLTSYNPNDHGQQGHTIQLSPTSTVAAATAAAGNSTGRTSSRARQAIQNFINSARSSRQVNRSLDSHSRDRQEALDNNYRRSADRNSQLVSLQNAIAAARLNADDSFNGHRSQSSSDRIRALDSLASRAQSQMNREVGLTANTSAVADQYRRNSTRAGRRQQAASDRVHDIARAAGMSDTQYRNASKKDKLKALAKYLTSNSNSQMDTLNDDLLGRMRGLQSSGNGASQAEINDIRRELERLTASHSLSSRHELYHHGIMGMHWGIRRYQPYRKGERVKGGKEVGEATKVEQRQDTNAKRSISSRILALTNKTERDWAKKVKADKKRQKEGFYDSETPEYKTEQERVMRGGISKEYDAATKRLREAEERYRRNPSDKTYRARGDAENAQVDALNRHMEKSGIPRYNDKWINDKVNSSSARYNELKRKLDKFDRKHGDKTSQEYYDREIAGRSTERNRKGEYVDKKRAEYERLKRERNQLEQPVNSAKMFLDTWESARTKNGSVKNARAQNDSKNFLVKNGIPAKVASKVVANKSLDELADMMKDAYRDPSLLRTAKNMTPDELERHLYG